MGLAQSHAETAKPAATGHRAPPRHLLNPAAILQLLPEIVLVEFETSPTFRVHYRLTGTQVDETNGVNLTHAYLDQFDDGHDGNVMTPLIDAYRRAWESAEAVIFHYHWNTLRGHVVDVCCGIFPLTIDGTVRQAIGIEEYIINDVLDRVLPLRHR
jgi:hypothetical protein